MELPLFLINTLVLLTEIHIIIRQEGHDNMVQMFVKGSPFSNTEELDSMLSDGNMKAVVQEGPHILLLMKKLKLCTELLRVLEVSPLQN